MWQVTMGRAIAGIGGAGMVTLVSIVLVGDTTLLPSAQDVAS